MILKISPKEDKLIHNILLCESLNIYELKNPNIVPLFGPNGIGKSTIIKSILEKSKYRSNSFGDIIIERSPEDITVYSYINSKDNRSVSQGRSEAETFNPLFLIDKLNSQRISEGQSIIYSIYDLFTIIGKNKMAIQPRENKHLLVLIDEMDSGLSIDNLDMLMRKMKYISRVRKDVQIIFSFNNPYVVKYFPEVISMYTGHPITLRTPDDMLNEIKQHQKEFRQRRYYKNGRPKIPE